jgi:hypothetical protein
VNFWNGVFLLIDNLIGFTPDKVTYTGVVGCFTKYWMYPVTYLLSLPIGMAMTVGGFLLSKKAFQNKNTNLMVFSAFFFYPVANGWAYRIIGLFTSKFSQSALWFIAKKAHLQECHISLIGNLYNFHWITFIIGNLLSIFYLILAYKIILNHWDKIVRIQFFTFGFLFCVLGKLFWYFFLGPLIY